MKYPGRKSLDSLDDLNHPYERSTGQVEQDQSTSSIQFIEAGSSLLASENIDPSSVTTKNQVKNHRLLNLNHPLIHRSLKHSSSTTDESAISTSTTSTPTSAVPPAFSSLQLISSSPGSSSHTSNPIPFDRLAGGMMKDHRPDRSRDSHGSGSSESLGDRSNPSSGSQATTASHSIHPTPTQHHHHPDQREPSTDSVTHHHHHPSSPSSSLTTTTSSSHTHHSLNLIGKQIGRSTSSGSTSASNSNPSTQPFPPPPPVHQHHSTWSHRGFINKMMRKNSTAK